jgi:hypothetical protein
MLLQTTYGRMREVNWQLGSIRFNTKNVMYHHWRNLGILKLNSNQETSIHLDVLQTGSVIKGPKWDLRTRLAVYIRPSMNHARSVGLALNLSTVLVSPIFHAKYDDNFSTVSDAYVKYITKSSWQLKCGY